MQTLLEVMVEMQMLPNTEGWTLFWSSKARTSNPTGSMWTFTLPQRTVWRAKAARKWDGIFTATHEKKHKKYGKVCTEGKDLFFACGSDILGNLPPEFGKFLSYMFTYIVHGRGFEKNKYEQGKIKAMFHKLKTDSVFCHARFVGAAWRRHINTTLGAGHNVGQALDADDLRFLKEAGHVDWHRLAA